MCARHVQQLDGKVHMAWQQDLLAKDRDVHGGHGMDKLA